MYPRVDGSVSTKVSVVEAVETTDSPRVTRSGTSCSTPNTLCLTKSPVFWATGLNEGIVRF